MRNNLNRLIVSLCHSFLLVSFAILIGCGGGGGGTSSPDPSTQPPATPPTSHAPVITGVQYSPHGAIQNLGNGAVTLTGTLNFTDVGGDIASYTINRYGPQEAVQLSTNTYAIQNASGRVSGSITLTGQISTKAIGDFTIEIFITDIEGNNSNKLTGAFKVADPNDVYQKTLLLLGRWHFVATDGTFNWIRDFLLSTISNAKNNEGADYVYGTNALGTWVGASYWPSDGSYSLWDQSTNFDEYYEFYTDGVTILGNSCYYLIDNTTGTWSSCRTLTGRKIP